LNARNRTLQFTGEHQQSPDPDGGGSLKHRAIRTTFDAAGRATKQELGTVNSQSDPDWAAFAALETVDIGYAGWRVTSRKLSGGGTAYALTHIPGTQYLIASPGIWLYAELWPVSRGSSSRELRTM
jgi:hypothetical protein